MATFVELKIIERGEDQRPYCINLDHILFYYKNDENNTTIEVQGGSRLEIAETPEELKSIMLNNTFGTS
ncbi:MAG: hypothetical protein AAFX87_24885 [Bacteroidota bacterium]